MKSLRLPKARSNAYCSLIVAALGTLLSLIVVQCQNAVLSTPPLLAQTVPPEFFGMHVMQSQDWPTVPLGSFRTWDSGNGLSRWDQVETSRGNYNWTTLDQWINLAQSKNATILMDLGTPPQWASSNPTLSGCAYGPGTCAPPANIQDWDDWVTAVVTHSAGRIKYWELWNEANTSQFYSGNISTLVTMAQHAYSIIKSIDPTAQVLSPSVIFDTSGWLNSYLAAGGGNYADVIAFHGYGGADPEGGISYAVGLYRQAMAANGQSSKPLWDTEGSWSTNNTVPNSDDQAAFVARHYLLHWSLGVARYYWYAWDNGNWGTLWDGSGIHPAGTAYQQIHDWMVGATLTAPCSQASDGTWSCPFTRSGGYQALAVWSPTANVSYTAASQYRQYRDLAGNTTMLPTNGVVTLTKKPILLETGSPNTTNLPPTAVLNVTPQSGVAPLAVTADGSGSTDPGGSIVSSTINFGDGTTATTSVASHTYTVTGTYTVTLTVVDNHGAQATTTKTVTVSSANVPPTAVLSVTPQSGTAPLTVTASGTGSTDPNGTISSWSISFGDGVTATTSSATHTYTAAGTYTVTLTVTDNGGLKSTATKTVTASAPTTTCQISTTNRTVTVCSPTPYSTVSSPVHFVATATDRASVHAMQIYVDYVLVYQVKNTNHIDTTLSMHSGSHHIAVKAWDYRGSYMRSFSITVQ